MDDRRALVLKRPAEYEDSDAFRKCRSLHQKIGFVLDKWEESVGDICPSVSRQELSCAEKCLDEAEKKLWKLVACQMTGAIVGGTGQNNENVNTYSDNLQRPLNTQVECLQREVLTTRHSPAASNQLVRVQRCVQVQNLALHNVETAQPKLMSINSNQQVLNLLVDWYISPSEKGVHLEGMLLNEGHWKTSPIAVRVGPTTLKTSSGTTYNISGQMCRPEGENIPEFVYENFRLGFPDNWQEVVQEWIALMEKERMVEIQQNIGALAKKGPAGVQNQVIYQEGAPSNKAPERYLDNEEIKMPPPTQPPHNLTRNQSKKNIMVPRAHSVMERGRHADKVRMDNEGKKSNSPIERRCSNRVLMRSLTDLSMNGSTASQNSDMSVDLNCLKRWGAEHVEATGELVLVGNLVSDSHCILDRNFVSSSVIRRLQPDLVETADGEIYRLLGPAHSSEMKLFSHGFPMRWKEYLKRGAFPVKTAATNSRNLKRRDSFGDKAANPSRNNAKVSRTIAPERNGSVSSTIPHPKRTSQMIQHIVRHNIKQSQNSTVGSKSENSLLNKKSESLNKRKNVSLLPLQGANPSKEMRPNDFKSAGVPFRSQRNGSEADVSSQSEQSGKRSQGRISSAKTDKKAEGVSLNMQSSRQEITSTTKKSAISSQLNTTGKYLAGMVSDVGSGDFDFNIF
ncbi:uncharacterized protein [Hetaerina americana]|uniref:uncharacterized protein n=1 Tax=Hetaerina americana TaxID=62018 RepID=UPI003A7F2C6A